MRELSRLRSAATASAAVCAAVCWLLLLLLWLHLLHGATAENLQHAQTHSILSINVAKTYPEHARVYNACLLFSFGSFSEDTLLNESRRLQKNAVEVRM